MESNLENIETSFLSKKHLRSDRDDIHEINNDIKYCIKIKNIPKYTSEPLLKNLLHQILADNDIIKFKIEKNMEWEHAYITFYSQVHSEKFISLLNEKKIVIKTNIIKGYYAQERRIKNIKITNNFIIHEENSGQSKTLDDQITPLHNMAYKDQLNYKKQSIYKVLPKQICDILYDTIESPMINGYRNKNEFTIGYNYKGEPSIGFTMGKYKDGIVCVESAENCFHISESHKNVCKYFEGIFKVPYFKDYPPYDRTKKKGFWRLLIIRSNLKSEIMVALQIDKQSINQNDLIKFEQQLESFFSKEEAESLNIKSLQLQVADCAHNGLDTKKPMKILKGKEYIEEFLFNESLKFRISLNSFFQVNTPCTEKLYSCIRDLAIEDKEVPESFLLDLCCGTGTIGITLAKYFKNVIGIDMVKEAIHDAELNASLNNITNIKFICAKLEDCLEYVIKKFIEPSEKFVVVLDPPRNGAHPSVIKALNSIAHKQKNLKRIIFVSCAAELAKKNFEEIMKFNNFVADKAIPIDMFPHTKHCELLVRFENTGNCK